MATSALHRECARDRPRSRSLPRSHLLVHASLLLTALVWGGSTTANKHLLGTLRPLDLAFLSSAGKILFALAILLASRRPLLRMPRADALRLLALGGVGLTVLNLAVLNGQRLLPATLAGLILAVGPIPTALLSRLVTGESLTGRKVGGMALALGGLAVVLLFGSGTGASLSGGRLAGVLILSLVPLSWAAYTVLSKPLLARYPPAHVAAYTSVAGSVAFLVVPWFRPGTAARIGDLGPTDWGAVGFSTLLAAGLGQLLWMRGLRALTPGRTAVYLYLVPVFGLLSAHLVLGEPVTPFLLLGGLVVLAGVALTNSPARRPARGRMGDRTDAPGALPAQDGAAPATVSAHPTPIRLAAIQDELVAPAGETARAA